MNEKLQRYDYMLMAILFASSYAVSHLVELQPAYAGVWMILMGVGVAMWAVYNGLRETGKVIGVNIPDKDDE